MRCRPSPFYDRRVRLPEAHRQSDLWPRLLTVDHCWHVDEVNSAVDPSERCDVDWLSEDGSSAAMRARSDRRDPNRYAVSVRGCRIETNREAAARSRAECAEDD